MTTNNSNLFDMALLAEASYVQLDHLRQNPTDGDIKDILKNGDEGGNFTQEQADYFVAHWSIAHNDQFVGHQANTETGFSATLFQNANDSSNFVYALRGTEVGM